MNSWKKNLANGLVYMNCRSSQRSFNSSREQLEAQQQEKLQQLLKKNRHTSFGKDHGFAQISSYDDFQNQVAVQTYKDFHPYVERLIQGEQNQLTAERVTLLEPTSGSTSGVKWIPYTKGLQAEFMAGVKPWLADLYNHYPKLKGGSSYWSISPAGQWQKLSSAIPMGFQDDSDYFGALGFLLKSIYPVSPQVRLLQNMDNFRYITGLQLLSQRDLRLFSLWNPSFLTLLMEYIEKDQDRLLFSLERGRLHWPGPLEPELTRTFKVKAQTQRAREFRYALQSGVGWGSRLWPELQLISCWTQGRSSQLLPSMTEYFPGVEVQGKGLLATEAMISLPLMGAQDPVLSYRSHFFEFLDQEGRPCLAHELKEGREYTPLVSTSGGFYRYNLGDRIVISGHHRGLPMVRFLGRDFCSDLVGEKLAEHFVAKALQAVVPQGTSLAMVAPLRKTSPRGYGLFMEGPPINEAQRICSTLEELFLENPHYSYARQLGQLAPLEFRILPRNASTLLQDFLKEKGQRPGDQKPLALYIQEDLEDCFFKERPCT